MSARPIPDHIRAAALADYLATREPYHVVAARHGISSSRLHRIVNPGPIARRPTSDAELGYLGTPGFEPAAWEMRGGVLRPLYPARRSA